VFLDGTFLETSIETPFRIHKRLPELAEQMCQVNLFGHTTPVITASKPRSAKEH
jgi:hypothetical protein